MSLTTRSKAGSFLSLFLFLGGVAIVIELLLWFVFCLLVVELLRLFIILFLAIRSYTSVDGD